MKKLILPAFGCIAILSACSGGNTPEAGQYKQSVKITDLDFPGMNDTQRQTTIQQMEQAAGGGTGGVFCMKSNASGEQWKQAASQMSAVLGGNCETTKDEGSATKIDLTMRCTGTGKGDIAVTMTGESNSEGYDSTMSFNIMDPNSGGVATLAMDIGAERIGDCPG